MTGANGEQHGVTSNSNVGSGNFDEYPHYLSRLEDHNANLNTAYLFTWGTDFLIPSYSDYISDSDDAGNVERVIQILNGSLNESGWALGTNPDAVFLFLDDSDHAGHSYGFDANVPEYIEELEELDGQLGDILDALLARPDFDEEAWQIILTSDHGGYHTSHGADTAPEHTIPFLVASRAVKQGRLPLLTSNLDVVPTVLEHMGLEIPAKLTGSIRGNVVVQDSPSLETDLIRYYRFEDNLDDSSNTARAAVVGDESDHDPKVHATGGMFGGYLSISDLGGGRSNSSYLTVGAGDDLNFDAGTAFSLTLWFRSNGEQSGDPLIIGNKDWASGGNPGWLMSANEGADNSFGVNFASSSSDRVDIEDIDYDDSDWWFLATVVHPGELAILYAGNDSGLNWIAYSFPGSISTEGVYPLNIGQDGTGKYEYNLDGDIDDLGLWRRALSHEEVLMIYDRGTGAEVEGLR